MSRFKHTAKTDARIRRGYEAGERVSSIAKDIGISRNAVIGRADRQGISYSPEALSLTRTVLAFKAHANPDVHGRMIVGIMKYNANRKANHSANLDAGPAE